MYKIIVLLNVGFNIILHCCKKRTALKLILNLIFKIAVCHTCYMLNWLYMHSLCKDPFNSTESSTLSEEPRWVILNLPAMYYIRSILLLCDMEFLPKLKETTEKWRPFCRLCTVFRFKRRKVDVTANLGYAPCMAAPVSPSVCCESDWNIKEPLCSPEGAACHGATSLYGAACVTGRVDM